MKIGLRRSRSGRVGSGLKRVQEIQCHFRENTPPPPTPKLTSEVNRPRSPEATRHRSPWPKIESRRVTLECQTKCGNRSVEVSSLTSQSFIISLLGNVVGSVNRSTPGY